MTMTTKTKDMTTGNPARLLLAFSMPLMLGNLFQQLYTFVDALIVGQCVGASALAALGVAEWLTFIMFGLVWALLIGVVTALIMSGIMIFAGRGILGLFIRETETGAEEMLRIGCSYLRVLAIGFPLLYGLYVIRSCIQGTGDSVIPMLSSFIQVFMRVMCALFLTRVIGNKGVFWGEVLAWAGADFFLIFWSRKTIFNLPENIYGSGN